MSIYSEREVYPSWYDEIDTRQCENCNFECGTIGFCLKDCGENYIVSTIVTRKGYRQCNIDLVFRNGENVPGVEIYKRQSQKFMSNLHELGHTCELYQHPLGKKYLSTIIIDGGVNPIDLCLDFLKLEELS